MRLTANRFWSMYNSSGIDTNMILEAYGYDPNRIKEIRHHCLRMVEAQFEIIDVEDGKKTGNVDTLWDEFDDLKRGLGKLLVK